MNNNLNFIPIEKKEDEEKQKINGNNNDISNYLDKIDRQIVSLLFMKYDNKKISSTLTMPLSVIQRRTRRILQSDLVNIEYTPNFKMLGIKKGFLHTYLNNGHLRETANRISEMEGVLSVSLRIGNSDIVSEFVYENNEDLVDIIASIKELGNIDRTEWSEEMVKLPSHRENIMKSFKKYWTDKTNQKKNNTTTRNNNNI